MNYYFVLAFAVLLGFLIYGICWVVLYVMGRFMDWLGEEWFDE